jgi:hypothetical protein
LSTTSLLSSLVIIVPSPTLLRPHHHSNNNNSNNNNSFQRVCLFTVLCSKKMMNVLYGSVWAMAHTFFLVDRMALAALFDSPLEDCPMLEASASLLAMPPAADSCNRPQECVARDECVQCTWTDTVAGTGCLDGCVYCNATEDLCVEHFGDAHMLKYTLFDSPVVQMGHSRHIRAMKPSEGNKLIGNFSLLEISGPVLECQAKFLGSPCLCEYRYCDAQQSTYDLFVDCSAIEGGAMNNGCDKTVEEWNDSWSLMKKMLSFRSRVCLAEPSNTNTTFMATSGDLTPRIDPELIIKNAVDANTSLSDPERKPSPIATTGSSPSTSSSGEIRVISFTAAAVVAVAAALLH